MRALAIVALLGLAAASLLVPAAPGYDAWSWLLWGREVAHLELSTVDGPAFKPLTVAITTVLAPAGAAAPQLWLVVARAGAAAAIVLAFAAARDLAGGNRLAGVAAAAGVALTDGFLLRAATGDSEPLLLALALAALLRARAGRPGQALALGALAALVRVEVWPFLAVYAAWSAHRDPRLRAPVLAGVIAVPALWFGPEWLGSGELWRSGGRALVPNPGAPAVADFPALESLRRAAGLLFWPGAAGAAALAAALVTRRRRTSRPVGAVATRSGAAAAPHPAVPLLPAAAGLAWLLLVALMAEAGFSGEERYAVPGAAAIAVSGGIGLAWLAARHGRPAVVAVTAALLVAGGARAASVAHDLPQLRRADALASQLRSAVDRAGGRAAVLACGRPAVGRYRGPMLAYALDVHKARVRADGAPAAVTFRSSLRGEPLSPAAPPGARTLARTPRWTVLARCAGPSPGPGRSLARVQRPR